MNRTTFSLLLPSLSLLAACATPDGADVTEAIGRGGATRADICHWSEDDQTFVLLTVPTNSAHFSRHGEDVLAGDWYEDADGDGYGAGAATECPATPTYAANGDDAFPADATEWADSDGDGVGDNSDACEGDDASGDMDLDGTCDDIDADIDGDGVDNADDDCPEEYAETANGCEGVVADGSVCAAFSHGDGTADLEAAVGYEGIGKAYLYTAWGAATPGLGAQGNRCVGLDLTELRAEVWDDPNDSAPSISTDWITVGSNPFVLDLSDETRAFTNGTDTLAFSIRDYMGDAYASMGADGWRLSPTSVFSDNGYQQGSGLAVSDGGSFQVIMGNLNSNVYRGNLSGGGTSGEIWMCQQNANCGHTARNGAPDRMILYYAR